MEQNLWKYLVMLKLNPAKNELFYNALKKLAEKPIKGIKIDAAFNVFGIWDCGLWFEAENNDLAINFVSEKIRTIDGVVETMTMPTAPLDLRASSGKDFVISKLNVETPAYFYTEH